MIDWKSGTTKIVAGVCAGVIAIGAGLGLYFGLRTPRSQQLRIMNWGDYIDEEIFSSFEKYYMDVTGKKINVVYKTFEDSEEAEREITKRKKDYDLICPSDYVIERLYNTGKLLPFNFSEVFERTAIEGAVYTDNITNKLDKAIDDWTEIMENAGGVRYAVPYMYGTNGIMYDRTKVDAAYINNSWAMLWNPNVSVSMKFTGRDSLAAATLYDNRDILKTLTKEEREIKLKELLNDPSEAMVESAKTRIKSMNIVAVDEDLVKDDMIKGSGPDAGLFWSCDAGFAMSENTDLEYFVPQEGSNIWVDGFVMPKYAKNTDAAHWFLNFICREDIAYLNMKASGACSPVKSARTLIRNDYSADDAKTMSETPKPFPTVAYQAMYVEACFPTATTLDRCVKFRAFKTESLIKKVNKLMDKIMAD